MKIAIIGGGIGGLALANCFNRKNIPYTMNERAHQFGEVGAGIGLSESTLTLLSKIGLDKSILDKGRFVRDAVIVDKKGNTIRNVPIENGGFCIHRADLIAALSGNIDTDDVEFSAEVSSFKTGENSVTLQFSNGLRESFDYVFACDGINSVFRQQLFPRIQKRYSGQTIWRGIASVELPKDFETTYYEFWGENLRFATVPINRNQYYWYACQPAPEGGRDNEETLKSDLKHLFRSFRNEVGLVIDQTETIIRNDMYDLKPHKEAWHKDRVILLGDAIHATTPNLAQGGCQAIEDAYTLAEFIHKRGFSEEVFEDYHKLRFKKVDYIVKQSWNYGKISHQKNRFFELLMSTAFKLIPKSVFVNQYKKLIDLSYLEH